MRKLSRCHSKLPRTSRFVCVAASIFWVSSLWAALPAAAEPPKQPAAESGSRAESTRSPDGQTETRNSSGKKVISLDNEFEIFGKLEKPSAFYVLRRSSLDFDWERLDARFTPLVLESVQDPLF